MNSRAIAAMFATAGVWYLCASAGASVHIVDQSGAGDFLTVQAAVDAAASRDTIVIRAGTYSENVVCVGKCLTYLGEGPGVTTVVAAADSPSVRIQNMPPSPGVSDFSDISIHAYAEGGIAVRWGLNRVVLREGEVLGQLKGGRNYPDSDHATVSVFHSDVTHIDVTGCYGTSIIENSHVGSVVFNGMGFFDWPSGASWCENHNAETTSSILPDVILRCCSMQSQHDEIGTLWGPYSCACHATESTFASIDFGTGDLQLYDCVVAGPIDICARIGVSDNGSWDLIMESTLIQGDLDVYYENMDDMAYCVVQLTHSTIIGDLITEFWMWYWGSIAPYRVRGNIVLGETVLDGDPEWWPYTTVSHNDFVGGFVASAFPDSIYANISEPPLFCDAGIADYQLQDCSPCVGAAHDGGDIGAFGVGCTCVSLVRETTWGRVKAMFWQPSN